MPDTSTPLSTGFQSPLVRELYELCHEVALPRIQDLHGFPGVMIKHLVNQFIPQLPQAFAALDGDRALQRQLMEQLEARYTRVKPEMERWLAEHDNQATGAEGPAASHPFDG